MHSIVLTSEDCVRLGFVPVEGGDGILADGKRWAPGDALRDRIARDEAKALRRKAAQAQQPQSPTTCTALIDGQLCGGTLIRAAVCPRCALGKSGVAATLTCDVCGHVTAVMRGENDG